MSTVIVGMPVFNGERYIAEAIRGVLAQTHDDLLLVISDNASTDATEEVCRSFAAVDDRVRYERLDHNVGAIPNFNRVAERARRMRPDAPYFKWAAHDDVCDPRFLGACISSLEADASLAVAYPRTVLIDDEGRCLDGYVEGPALAESADPIERFAEVLRHEVWCFPVFGVIRAGALAATPLLRPFSSSDKVLLSHLALLGRFRRVDEPLFFRRTHSAQLSVMNARDKARWARTRHVNRVPLPLLAGAGYLDTVRTTTRRRADRLRGYRAVAALLLQGDKWRKLLLPGPYNYLGWRGSNTDALGHLELEPREPLGAVIPRNAGRP